MNKDSSIAAADVWATWYFVTAMAVPRRVSPNALDEGEPDFATRRESNAACKARTTIRSTGYLLKRATAGARPDGCASSRRRC